MTQSTSAAAHPVSRTTAVVESATKVSSIKPIFVVGGLYSLSNGVAWIMKDLAAALGSAGVPVDVYGAECPDRGMPSIGHIFESPSQWLAAPGRWLGGLSWSPKLKSLLREAVASTDVVHNHSIWMLPNSYASRMARRAGKPVIYTAHGALEPWALKNSGWKKRMVGAWFQNADLRNADCIHVNSHAEAEGIRRLGIKSPIAVIPNGVNLDEFDLQQSPEPFLARFPELRGKRLMLFMARLHEKKGLGHLIPAWGRLADQFPDWHLVIAGPDGGYLATAQHLVADNKLNNRVTFTGPLDGEIKRSARAVCEVFVQPSFSEGFSMAILEAMAAAKPVLMTSGCNFREAVVAGAALEVEAEIESTIQGLQCLFTQSPCELKQMGERGRRLVVEHYQWQSVAMQVNGLYRWLHGDGDRPGTIID